MKLCFVYDMIYPFSKGGAEKRFHQLASRLAGRHEVHWVGLKQWDGPSTRVTEDGVVLHGVAKPPGSIYVRDGRRSLLEPVWFGLALFQWPDIRKMDVVVCSSFPYFSIFSARLLACLGRARLGTTWHEFWGEYWDDYAFRVAPIGKLVERLAVKTSGTTIAVSDYTRAKLIGAGMAASSISVVPNGVDRAAIEKVEPMPDGPDVLFVGRLIKEKRVEQLLRAMASDPVDRMGATCWVVGEGPDAGRLKGLATSLGIDSRVSFLSSLDESEVYAAMKSAKVVVQLSEREGFGMVVLEAMACGTPVIVSPGKNSAAPDLVSPGETGFIVPPEPQRLGQTIAALLSSGELRRSMGSRAREKAARYDWARIAEEAEAVYLRAARTQAA